MYIQNSERCFETNPKTASRFVRQERFDRPAAPVESSLLNALLLDSVPIHHTQTAVSQNEEMAKARPPLVKKDVGILFEVPKRIYDPITIPYTALGPCTAPLHNDR